MTEYEFEPIPGLPGHLPPGELLVWQGMPRWQTLARSAFHVRALAVYFGVLIAWRVVASAADGQSVAAAVTGSLWLLPAAAAALGLLCLLAWLIARSTIYSVTNRRIVMRFGVAVPMMINLPFKVVESASLRTNRDGTGDITVSLMGDDRIAYLHLWPHVRPWRLKRTQPALRSVADAEEVAAIVARVLAASVAEQAPVAAASPLPTPSRELAQPRLVAKAA
jgi:hypothetical protein